MKTNKTFGRHGGVNTPFHQVHFAKSGEIVNELNSPICSCEIDEIPAATRNANAQVVMLCLNSHDELVQALNRVLESNRRAMKTTQTDSDAFVDLAVIETCCREAIAKAAWQV